ncbi:MAG TPA: xanthine dehydrogenase family protein molybdopterin-binding subunit [Usitatibacter sp.]|nr:xanthine dehydrogenase family protein molybdopterin-binding subunit [Usitatibacter sp.]
MSATPIIGQPLDRVDGRLKVTGHATYVAEFAPGSLCHAVMVCSTIARGHVVALDTQAARAMPGVIEILTHENAPQLPEKGRAAVEPPAGREKSLLQDNVVRYNGEPIAVVVAETLEQAMDAAAHVRATYREEAPELVFEEAKGREFVPLKAGRMPPDKTWGDPKRAMAAAPLRVEAVYSTPMENHNPIEMHATVAEWDGDRLTVHESTQYISGTQEVFAKTFGIPLADVRVVCPFVGGGFGSKGSVWSHAVLAAMAARVVHRPVKLVVTRAQMFGNTGGRPRTEQRIVLGAERDGRLLALEHHVVSHTCRFEDFVEPSAQPSRDLYACANGSTTQRLVRLDVGTPTFQRAPGESTGTFAIESAMDELAYAAGIDPLELRLRNYAHTQPWSGKPWSSKRLRECYHDAAQRFGWERRSMPPRSQRDGRWLVGWGLATATYPAHLEAAEACATLMPDGMVIVRSGTQDLGTGTYTAMTMVAAETLGLPVERVRFELGDSRLPKAPTSGGSMTVASVAPAVRAACEALRGKLLKLAGGDGMRIYDPRPELVEATGRAEPVTRDEEKQAVATRSFGAVFAEVRVDAELAIVRVPRIVASYSVGRAISLKTALSQLEGGIVMGVGMALLEESLLDTRSGRIANANLADYHVPVNADIGSLDVTIVEENDTRFNSLGARGIGEIGITGVAGALANAVFHATGKRVRDLPITLDKLLPLQEN